MLGKQDPDREEGPLEGAMDGAALADGPGAAVGFAAGLWSRIRRRRNRPHDSA